MTHRGRGKLPPRLAVCEPRGLPFGREWVIHLEPQTECTGTSTGTNQQTNRKGHQPSHIAHRTKAITRLPISEGSCQNPDTRDDDSLVQFAQSFVQYFLRHMPCCLLSLQPTRLQFLPASCNVAAQRQEEKDSFTLSLLCRRPREPGTSLHPRRNQRPSTINPNLIRPSSKRPFFSPRHTVKQQHSTLPETRIHSHTSAWPTTAWPHCPCSNQGLLAIYLGVRTDVTFASTHLQ